MFDVCSWMSVMVFFVMNHNYLIETLYENLTFKFPHIRNINGLEKCV